MERACYTHATLGAPIAAQAPIREHIIRRLKERKYQEKQVDASVVALLVRSAITRGDDYHLVITGDADILPGMRVAYPEFTKNVLVCTTHPDELNKRHRQTAHALVEAEFKVPPFYCSSSRTVPQDRWSWTS